MKYLIFLMFLQISIFSEAADCTIKVFQGDIAAPIRTTNVNVVADKLVYLGFESYYFSITQDNSMIIYMNPKTIAINGVFVSVPVAESNGTELLFNPNPFSELNWALVTCPNLK